MRSLCLLAALFTPLAMADSLSVEAHSLMRLPGKDGVVQLDRLDVADYATLLIPANLTELKVGELRLGHEARIAIVPADHPLRVQAKVASFAEGSQILARGAPGTYEKAALPGRDLDVQLQTLQAPSLTIDARGGTGAPGYFGLDGANGKKGGCLWGQASRGADGLNGGNGHDGAAGARVHLQVPRSFPAEAIKVQVQGGSGGAAGTAGKPGAGGASNGCLVYSTDKGRAGHPGEPGQPGVAGEAGAVTVQRM
ncbi:MAG: collagen-like protein [Pseudomonas sp.]|uniref:collagen-like protein n=1 Tax=Pseudomonas abieticivorans TaxID=2931382 RepID=UPI0020BFD06B|nr:collagen-like protein [Pseudomonas sp. PIA16]MDE1164153.1 collagen-like protein [Pseudomonas sp.]